MQKAKFLPLFLLLSACVGQPSLKDSLIDASTVPPASMEAEELRLGDIRYGKQRLEERESLGWAFLTNGAFQRGTPRGDEAASSIRVKIYEVGQVERGKFRGFALERWDVIDESSGNQPRHYHHYFARSPNRLVHLARMTKGPNARPLWEKNRRGQQVLNYLGSRWNVSLGEDTSYEVPELKWHRHITVPGEGLFRASANGESMAEVEARNGALAPLANLPRGREVYRVPGDWLICVFPDGLALPLQRE